MKTYKMDDKHNNLLFPRGLFFSLKKIMKHIVEVVIRGQLSSRHVLCIVKCLPTNLGGCRIKIHIRTHPTDEVLEGDVDIDFNVLCRFATIDWDTS